MVQSYQSPVRVYKYPFELVMAAYERRFPTCPLIPIFIASEITNRYQSPDRSLEVIERRCKLNVDIPYLLKKIIGVDYALFIQKNSLDRRKRSLHIEAHNESFANRIVVHEKCSYYVHPDNADWTCFEQSGTLDIRSFFGFEATVEKLAVKQYSINIAKGKEIIELFINELRKEGITYIPPYQEPEHVGYDSSGGSGTQEGDSATVCNLIESCEELGLGATAASIKQSTLNGEQYRLDAEYIECVLGLLTPMQESRLLLLRKCVGELHKGKLPSDGMLLRFLRARDFNVEKARDMLCQSLVWRKKHQVDRLLDDYRPCSVVADYFCGAWHGSDKDGRPLYVLRLGHLDVKGLLKSIGQENHLKLVIFICEEGLRRCEEATRALGRPIHTWTMLVDMDGLAMRHLWRPAVQTLLRITEIVEANYPETLGRVLVTRAPRVFAILWTVISTFIEEVTRSKIWFNSADDGQVGAALAEMLTPENIPDFLGGVAKVPLPDGGLVPKSMYMASVDHLEKERNLESPPLCEDIYHCITLQKGQVHEVVVHSDDVGSVICWDFDVVRHDLVFQLLRIDTELTWSAGASTEKIEDRSVLDKACKESEDYFVVESTVCQDGESIQGSHVTSHSGSYVLQWSLQDNVNVAGSHSALPHARDIIDSLTTHSAKAKLMYFYQVLNSDDYKGSMTSLQSGQSEFSSLSNQTSVSAVSR